MRLTGRCNLAEMVPPRAVVQGSAGPARPRSFVTAKQAPQPSRGLALARTLGPDCRGRQGAPAQRPPALLGRGRTSVVAGMRMVRDLIMMIAPGTLTAPSAPLATFPIHAVPTTVSVEALRGETV